MDRKLRAAEREKKQLQSEVARLKELNNHYLRTIERYAELLIESSSKISELTERVERETTTVRKLSEFVIYAEKHGRIH